MACFATKIADIYQVARQDHRWGIVLKSWTRVCYKADLVQQIELERTFRNPASPAKTWNLHGEKEERTAKKNAWRCDSENKMKKQLNINHKDSPELGSLTDWCWWTMFIWKQKGWIIQNIIPSWVWR